MLLLCQNSISIFFKISTSGKNKKSIQKKNYLDNYFFNKLENKE